MRGKVAFVLLGLALVALLAAPSMAAGKFGVGGKAGLNFAKVYGDDSQGAKMKTGFVAGAYFDMPLSNVFSFHPEVLYWQSGAKAEDGGISITLKMDYIEIPVLLYFRLPNEQSQMTPMFYFGPSIGIKASAKAKGEFGGASAEADINNAKSTNFGLCFGGGGELAMGSNKFIIDVRFTMGLTDLYDDVTPPIGDNDLVGDDTTGAAPSLKSYELSVLLGFGI